jgi:hypothetical protein
MDLAGFSAGQFQQMQPLLNRKYDIMQTQANAQANQANSQAALNKHLLDPASDAALTAFWNNSIFGAGAFGANQGMNFGGGGMAGGGGDFIKPGIYDGTPETGLSNPQHFATGTANVQGYEAGATKVPGKGSGMVDKVPAMLAPGEAVLNAGAAEHFGRDKIAALNAIGHAKMQQQAQPGPMTGQPQAKPQEGDAGQNPHAPTNKPVATQAHPKTQPKAPQKPAERAHDKPGSKPPAKAAKPAGKAPGAPQELSRGTHMVGHGKSAPTPQLSPGVLQSLMGMMGGGGGMVPPAAGPGGGRF